MAQYSEQDLKYASELREEIHREALAIVRKTRPHVTEVLDRHPVEDYFREHWDYPGRWYTVVAIPEGYKSRRALVDTIVRDTLTGHVPQPEPDYTQMLREAARADQERRRLGKQLDARPKGYRELFVIERDSPKGSFRAVGTDGEGRYVMEHVQEYGVGGATGSQGAYYLLTDLEYQRFARLALVNGHLSEEDFDRLTAKPKKPGDDPFYALIEQYPDLTVDYGIVPCDGAYRGYESHRRALHTACATVCEGWENHPERAVGKPVEAATLFSSEYEKGKLNYRRAFLYPPHTNRYTGKDFVRVNNALFPNGTDDLEVYQWSTDWSDYFDDGREWWGTLCLTVYDKSKGRFAVIMASATD